jgi:hypothetical protein
MKRSIHNSFFFTILPCSTSCATPRIFISFYCIISCPTPFPFVPPPLLLMGTVKGRETLAGFVIAFMKTSFLVLPLFFHFARGDDYTPRVVNGSVGLSFCVSLIITPIIHIPFLRIFFSFFSLVFSLNLS